MTFLRDNNIEKQPKHKGQATVELALIVTFVFLLLAGVSDAARIFTEQQAVVHAAGVGARWLTLDPNAKACAGYPDIESVIREDIGNAIPQDNLIMPVTYTTGSGPNSVTVSINYRHDFFFGILKNVMGTTFTGRASM